MTMSDNEEMRKRLVRNRTRRVLREARSALQAIADQLERVGDTRPHKDGEFINDARIAIVNLGVEIAALSADTPANRGEG